MNRLTLLCLGLISPALLQNASLAHAADTAHEHHAATTSSVMMDHGKLWGTDQALRDGMTSIRTALADNLAAIHDNTLNKDGYAALAASLETALSGIFAHCKLPPAADAQLHNILLPINSAAGHMKQAATTDEQRKAAFQVMASLKQYGEAFDHPGWQPL